MFSRNREKSFDAHRRGGRQTARGGRFFRGRRVGGPGSFAMKRFPVSSIKDGAHRRATPSVT